MSTTEAGTETAGSEATPIIVQEQVGGSDAPWYDALDAGLRSEPTIQRYKTMNDFGHAFLEQKKALSQKGLVLPKEDAPETEIREKMAQLGCPETPEQYDLGEFKPPEGMEWSEDFQGKVLGMMHRIGLNSAQARILMSDFAGELAGFQQASADQAAEVTKGWGEEIRQAFGKALNIKLEAAQKAFRAATGGDEQMATELSEARLPSGGKLGDHPGFVKMMAQIGESMGESDVPGAKRGTSSILTPDQAKAQLESLRADPKWMERWANPNVQGHKEANRQYMELMELMHPEEEPT